MNKVIEVKNVSKIFGKGKKEFIAVNDICFEIYQGEVFGLLGCNGAGKTTTLRMLATMLEVTKGEVIVNGFDVKKNKSQVRKSVGLLFGGDTGLYDRLTARENIAYFGELYDMPKDEIDKRITELSNFFRMNDYLDREAGKFSRGMKQKTAFARTIIHNPEIMFFDEPSAGLDILAAEEVIDFIKECKKLGKTILLSSHDMAEVEELCDRIAIIDKGVIIDTGTLDELKKKHNKQTIKEVFFSLVGGK